MLVKQLYIFTLNFESGINAHILHYCPQSLVDEQERGLFCNSVPQSVQTGSRTEEGQ